MAAWQPLLLSFSPPSLIPPTAYCGASHSVISELQAGSLGRLDEASGRQREEESAGQEIEQRGKHQLSSSSSGRAALMRWQCWSSSLVWENWYGAKNLFALD